MISGQRGASILVVACGLVGGACGPPAAAQRPAAGPVATELTTPGAVPLLSACTPTAPELCFNATDDNCNGIIDEGCGSRTGSLQFAIAWPNGPDVDLIVTDPTGAVAGSTTEGETLHKDRDCGRDTASCHGQNIENVYFDGAVPPSGKYRVVLKLVRATEDTLPVKVRLGGRIGAQSFAMDVDLAAVGEEKALAFVVR